MAKSAVISGVSLRLQHLNNMLGFSFTQFKNCLNVSVVLLALLCLTCLRSRETVNSDQRSEASSRVNFAMFEEDEDASYARDTSFTCCFKRNSINLVALTKRCCSVKNILAREFLAEVMCTFLLITIGCGSLAQYVLEPNGQFNIFLSVDFAWGIAITLGVLVSGKISGAHMNPSVSFSMFLLGNLTALRLLVYTVGQCVGAFIGSMVVYICYLDAINEFDGGARQVTGKNATANIWASYPSEHLSQSGAFFDQVLGTGILIICILAINDHRNSDISYGLKALLCGKVVFAIGLSFGKNCGFPINPVRDFIPRVFTSISGWGVDVFKAGGYYFWIPLIAPFFGAAFGTFIYAMMIGNHWPNEVIS